MSGGALREILASFGIDVDDKKLQAANTTIGGAIGALKSLGAALAGAAIVQGFASFVRRSVEAGSELHDVSQQLGVSTDALQRWRYAAGQVGVEGGALTQAFMRLQRGAAQAADGSGEARDAFARLGVSVRGSDGQLRSADDLMRETARGLGGVTNATERAALAQTIFGRSGQRLLPLFADGVEGIDRMSQEFDELGGGLSGDFIESADALGDNLDRWDLAMEGIRSTIGVVLLPVLTRLMEGVIKTTVGLKRFFDQGNRAKAIMIVLGAAAVLLGLKFLWGFAIPIAIGALVAAVLGLIALAVDDLLTFMDGGPSVIGEFMDALFGEGSADELRERIASFPRFVEQFLGEALTFWRDFFGAIYDGFTGSASELGRWLGGLVVGVYTFVTQAIGYFGGLYGQIVGVVGMIEVAFTSMWGRVVAAFQSALATVTGGIAGAASFLGISIPSVTRSAPVAAPSGRAGAAVSVPAPAARGPTVRQQNVQNITIQTSDRQVAEVARAEVTAATRRERRAAQAALEQAAGG